MTFGNASTSGSAGPAKSRSPNTTSTGHVTFASLPSSSAGRARPHAGHERFAIVARLAGQSGEVLRGRIVVGGLPVDRPDDVVARVVTEQVRAHARHHEMLEAVRLLGRDREQHARTQGEPDRVELSLWQLRDHE